MRQKNLMAIAIMGMILGASGFGFGAYAIVQMQTLTLKGESGGDGDDGSDGLNGITTIDNIITFVNGTLFGYSCNTEAEIIEALDTIGNGYGIITIVKNITLTQTININGGGNYIIQGIKTVIDCNGDRTAFSITNAKSCTIQNLRVDASDITGGISIIYISNIHDNPVLIENLQIIGDSDKKGYGINIQSNNVTVRFCYIEKLYLGITLTSTNTTRISDNSISDLDNCAIYQYMSDKNIISTNFITGFSVGIESYNCQYDIISENIIIDGSIFGINFEFCNNTIISGNLISDIYQTSTSTLAGIYLKDNANNNTVSSNSIFNVKNFGTSTGYGILIGGTSNNNSIVGNTCLNNEDNYENWSSSTNESGNNFS